MALFKNKDTDKKRKGENVIGKVIYGFLLFAPLMSILFTSLYTVFNKNAYESYYGDTINEQQIEYVKNMDNFIAGVEYYFSNTALYPSNSTSYVDKLYVTNLYVPNTDVSQVSYITFYSDNQIHIYFRNSGGTTLFSKDATNPEIANISFTFNYFNVVNTQTMNDTLNCLLIRRITYNKYSYLDNSFEYGMYKTEQSNIYNWSKSTGTYTVLQNVCTGIGITNTFVPMLMAYWLLISIIYFLFDIALILIWAVHDKIHALKDAI